MAKGEQVGLPVVVVIPEDDSADGTGGAQARRLRHFRKGGTSGCPSVPEEAQHRTPRSIEPGDDQVRPIIAIPICQRLAGAERGDQLPHQCRRPFVFADWTSEDGVEPDRSGACTRKNRAGNPRVNGSIGHTGTFGRQQVRLDSSGDQRLRVLPLFAIGQPERGGIAARLHRLEAGEHGLPLGCLSRADEGLGEAVGGSGIVGLGVEGLSERGDRRVIGLGRGMELAHLQVGVGIGRVEGEELGEGGQRFRVESLFLRGGAEDIERLGTLRGALQRALRLRHRPLPVIEEIVGEGKVDPPDDEVAVRGQGLAELLDRRFVLVLLHQGDTLVVEPVERLPLLLPRGPDQARSDQEPPDHQQSTRPPDSSPLSPSLVHAAPPEVKRTAQPPTPPCRSGAKGAMPPFERSTALPPSTNRSPGRAQGAIWSGEW